METLDAIRSRRNVRVYEDRPIDDADLQQILDAGRRTPSSRNEQRWDFVVVRDRDRLERLSHIWQGARISQIRRSLWRWWALTPTSPVSGSRWPTTWASSP
jgi:nitroreductase